MTTQAAADGAPWQEAVEELERRRLLAEEMGGAERVARQHEQGKLTVRERIAALVDPGSFTEVGKLAGSSARGADGTLQSVTPATVVMGIATIDGRQVAVAGDDYTIRGGSRGESGDKLEFIERLARECQIPLILLHDGAGANVQTIESLGHTYMPSTRDWSVETDLMGMVPVAAAILGPAAGFPAARAMLSHWVCMVTGIAQMFAAGPPVVQRAIGEKVSREELGGVKVHVDKSGAAQNAASSEADCFGQIRRFLSYLPSNVWQMPPVTPTDDPVDRADELLATIVPSDRKKPYNMRRIVESVVDRDSFFEIYPRFGRALIIGFGRMAGIPIGVIANNPKVMGGALDTAAAEKLTYFLELCDTFHLPLVDFIDVPGIMVGSQAEATGAIRKGMRMLWTMYQIRVPVIDVVVRKCYGMAGAATGNPNRMNLRLAWPSGEWGSIPIEGGVDAAFRRQIETSDDPAATRRDLEAQLTRLRSPLASAEAFAVEDIIDPRQTRARIVPFLRAVLPSMERNLGPTTRAGFRP